MKNKILSLLKFVIPVGAAIGLVRFQSNIYGSLNPMLALIFLVGNKQGKLKGALVGLVATLVSSVYCGFGPWVLMQSALWILSGVLGGCFKSKLSATQFACIYGFMFGVVMDIFSFYTTPFMMYPNVFAQIAGGIPFDIRYCLITTGAVVAFYVVEYSYNKIKSSVKNKLVLQN